MDSKLPLHDIEAEKSLIGSLLVKPGLIDSVYISPDDFYSVSNRNTFTCIMGMISREGHAAADALPLELKKQYDGKPVLSGEDIYIILSESPIMEVERYQRRILDCSITRRVKDICSRLSQSGKIGDDLLSVAQSEIMSINSSCHQDEIKRLGDIINEHVDRIETANISEDDGEFYRLGFPNLDRCLKTKGPMLIIIAGRPGMGKTSLALSMARNLNRSGVCLGFLSIEMPEFQIIDRLLSMESSIDASKFGRFNGLKERDFSALTDAAAFLYDSNILLDSGGSVDILDVERKCRKMKKRGAELIFIDQLSQIGNREIRQGELTVRYSENTTRLSALKKELGIPIFLLAQLNRDLKNRSDKLPILSDLKQSGRIEEDADAVIFVHRPEEYAATDDEKAALHGVAIIDIAKNRAGAKYREKNIIFNHPTTFFYQEKIMDIEQAKKEIEKRDVVIQQLKELIWYMQKTYENGKLNQLASGLADASGWKDNEA